MNTSLIEILAAYLCPNPLLPFLLAIYMPIKNKAVEKLFLKIRERYGTKFIDATEFREEREEIFGETVCVFLAADQNPGIPLRPIGRNFFNQTGSIYERP
ncbi:MAG: hypothetical protein IPP96_07080 [Chitinophagaceae bacterium]|nr:hypothetical protein [Chitinophagaceae bacterium]